MTPEPALWNCRSRGFASGGISKKRRKKGSSIKGLRCPGLSLIVPRVATLTTAGETRLTIGAREGMGAASAGAGVGNAANAAGPVHMAMVATSVAANLIRRFMRIPLIEQNYPAAGTLFRSAILHARPRAADPLRPPRLQCAAAFP